MRDKDTSNPVIYLLFCLLDIQRGFGFVTFRDYQVFEDVVSMTPHIIDGKLVCKSSKYTIIA
jgi:hypothetical protein